MRLVVATLFLIFISFLSTEVYTIINPGVKPIKKPKATKKTNCCALQAIEQDNVRLIKLCQTKQSTLIYMNLENTANACSYLDKISLVDDKGKSYNPIAIHGISNCPKANLIQGHSLFSWEFEKLDKNTISITIEEDSTAPNPTSGAWNWWSWKEVTVGHCNL
jgi:hypothetical protein